MHLPFESVLENVRFLKTLVSKNLYFFVLEWTQDKNETRENECLFKRKPITVDAGGGEGGTPYNGLYGEARTERGTFSRRSIRKGREICHLGL